MLTLNDSIKYLKGVGEKRADYFKKLDIFTPLDLLYHFPRDYTDYSNPIKIADAVSDEYSVIKGTLLQKMREANIRHGLTIYKAIFSDGETDFTVVFYNNRYAFEALKENEEYYLYGKVTGGFLRREISSPNVLKGNTEELFQPVYHLTEGVTAQFIQNCIKQALLIADNELYDYVPKEILEEHNLCVLPFALRNIHFPKDEKALEISRKRLSFDELFLLQLGMLYLRGRNRELSGYQMKEKNISPFEKSLPFSLTNAQKKSVKEIISDMCKNVPMNRLLQGDVGSGKTAVAAAACYFCYLNGCQSALMAPTEILAVQHYNTLKVFLEPLGVSVCLLIGSLTPKQKNTIKEEILQGKYSVVTGTHALVQQSTEFKSLGLVITDEQHRFGVNQRAALADKGNNPHTLVMSATPIPRTLGLIIYGDLDISVLNELPKGRKEIKTYAVTGKLRERAFGFIKKQLDEGRQGYIVCPMIEESDSDLIAVKSYYEKLKDGAFKGYSLGLLHGKLSAAEKDRVMSAFKSGDIQLLISTTVIEVGVDVPNATVMAIENSDRFGLSQLHQLRGRVGRGEHQSFCILITDNVTPEIKERLEIMSATSDGFKIAEEDMKMRGCGDFFGERQHGLPPMKIASLDSEMLSVSQKCAKQIVEKDSSLKAYPKLKKAVDRLFEKNGENGLN
ncbi:MAG TPA: ATP-dependent DNA helicase RecG [Oscillospiraceae bacterium]|nr:ATP-dependent DNA helicase RecG [Oscillospiraceae bacterium]